MYVQMRMTIITVIMLISKGSQSDTFLIHFFIQPEKRVLCKLCFGRIFTYHYLPRFLISPLFERSKMSHHIKLPSCSVQGEQEIILHKWNRKWWISFPQAMHHGINTILTFRWSFKDTQLPNGVAFSSDVSSSHVSRCLPSTSQISAFYQ